MSNMGLKSKYTGNNYNKEEKMWNDCSDDTGSFPKLNNTKKNDIKGTSGNSWQKVSLFSVPGC